jgi:protein-tyrosine phosphatase
MAGDAKKMTKKKKTTRRPLKHTDHDEYPVTKYTKVKNRIYLGNSQSAHDKEFFHKKNIKAVLNCTKDIPNYFAQNREIEYMRIPVNDELQEIDYEQMYQFLPVAVAFIHKHVNLQKNNILIHCLAGRQRSAISIAAYLVAQYNMTPSQACDFVLSKRPEAFQFGESVHFRGALNRYYKDMKRETKTYKDI